MENRRHPRIRLNNPSIIVSDGMGPIKGLVSDLSVSGMRINNLPKRLNLATRKLSAIFSEDKKLFRMNVKPKWYLERDGKISMGVKITDTPLKWSDFVHKHEI